MKQHPISVNIWPAPCVKPLCSIALQDHAQPAIKSMSPFLPSSTENSGAIASLNKKHANQGTTNGAPLNYDGEVLGTITRVDNTDSAEALKNQAKPCSALLNFKMKKRYDSWRNFSSVHSEKLGKI